MEASITTPDGQTLRLRTDSRTHKVEVSLSAPIPGGQGHQWRIVTVPAAQLARWLLVANIALEECPDDAPE